MASGTDLTMLIAHAIRSADKSYLFEDYTSQAEAVRRALRHAGFVIVRADPDEATIERAVQSLPFGAQKPADLVRVVWQALLGRLPGTESHG